jgi:hypothetical protein
MNEEEGDGNKPDILTLLKRLEEAEAHRLVCYSRELRVAGRIYSMNAQELRESLADFNKPPLALQLWSADNKHLFAEYYKEIIRAFHNFLASVSTLIDHYRAFIRRFYANHEFRVEHDRKVSEMFGSSPLAAFVKGLRNYVLHSGIPPTAARLSHDTGRVKSAVYLNISELQKWDRWPSKARSYFASSAPDIDLLDLVEEYDELIRGFYEWFDTRVQEIHRDALDEYDQLDAAVEEAWRRRAEGV